MASMTIQQAYELALQHHRAGRLRDAESLYRQILTFQPDHPNARIDLGTSLRQQGRFEEAFTELRLVLMARPDLPELHASLGNYFLAKRQWHEAADAFREAIRLLPAYALAHNNLGMALQNQGRTDEAIVAYRRALALQPDFVDAYTNLGTAFWEMAEWDSARDAYESALAIQPTDAKARMNLGLCLLLHGDFERGWEAYEARRCVKEVCPETPLGEPLWDGRPLNDRTILLHSEQGLGDTIQFVRYAPLVAALGGVVVLRCQAELKRLMTGQAGISQVVADTDPSPDCDVRFPLLSLPRLFRTIEQTIPNAVPYLIPDSSRVEHWRGKVSHGRPGLNVGIVWAGNPSHRYDRRRSIALSKLAPLARTTGVWFFSLQKGEAAAQARTPPLELRLTDWTSELHDFVDTAALVASLDLIISVDTAVAHLAAALGKPVWMLLPFVPDWRWMRDRSDSPWYPTLRLFRQSSSPNDWDEPIARVARELEVLARRKADNPDLRFAVDSHES